MNYIFARSRACAFPFGSLLLALAGCTGERSAHADEGAPAERRIATSAWDTLWVLGGTMQDSVLPHPSRLAAGGDRVYVFDAASARLLAVSATDGSVAWTAGRTGSGPGEFKRVRDLELDEEGRPILLDVGNGRITTLDRAGSVLRETRLRNVGYADQFAPLPDGRAVLLTEHPDSALAVVDETGDIIRRIELPWAEFARLHPLVRQGTLASGRNGRWAFGFGLGDGWFGFHGTTPEGGRRAYVERAEFPRVVEKREGNSVTAELASYTPCSACGMAMDGTELYVLFGGRTDQRGAVLDRYDLSSGTYRESLVLPGKAKEAAVANGVIYVLVDNPYPALLALRPRMQR